MTTSCSAPRPPRVLSIAGTDPSGGAGTAADTKSITAAGGYAMTVVTCLVAQNTTGVRAVHTPPIEFLSEQLAAVSEDVTVDAVKTGMLGTARIITTVSDWLDRLDPRVLVVDAVMIATSGDRLLDIDAEEAMRQFCRRASVITPNVPELAVLLGEAPARDEPGAIDQAKRWAARTGVDVVVKTGHLESRTATNTWVHPDGSTEAAASSWVDTTNTHGTGCSLSSALATRLGQGDAPAEALGWVTDWLHEAILHGAQLEVGKGNGPVDHGHLTRRLTAAASVTPWVGVDEVPDELDSPDDVGAAVHVPRAEVPAAGPWTEALWRAGAKVTRRIEHTDFVAALVDGSLSRSAFDFYLAQDAHYLNDYSRALAALSARATERDEGAFWARSASTVLVEEAELHRTWLDGRPPAAVSPVTRSYTDFLMARALGDDYPVGVAAVLPCYWLYAHVGAILPQVRPDHPYAAWLETYRDPAFVEATVEAIRTAERALRDADPRQRAEAVRAHLVACRHELEFFEQGTR